MSVSAFRERLSSSLPRATQALLARQRPDGSWNAAEDDEPTATATQVILESFLGRLHGDDAHDATRFLITLQNADGSFPGYPGAPSDVRSGSLSVTALSWAALVACKPAAGSDAAQALMRARGFVDAHGGVDAVVARFYSHSDQTALWLAMVGLVDPKQLPAPEVWFSLLPPLVRLMEHKVNAGVIMGLMAMGFITRLLRARQKAVNLDLLWLVHRQEAEACARYLGVFQNPDGNFDGNTVQTALYAAGLYAAAGGRMTTSVTRATAWLDAQKQRGPHGLRMRIFTCENWMTTYALRGLLQAGVPRDHPQIDAALRFLCRSQITTDMPRVDQRKRGAALSGGWAFQPSNPTMPDCDDTGSVLSALGLALRRDDGPPLSPRTTDLVQRAVDLGLPQLLDMQSPAGGWSAFVWNLGHKAPGPMFTKPLPVPRTLLEQAAFFLNPPVEMGEPAVEGLTGRVLEGLGTLGYQQDSPVVARAARFLKEQRADNGVWWGRWLVNYLPESACVISGLAAVQFDMTTPWVTQAVDWIVARQNPDGGFGETPASYTDPSKAGVGPSMPPVTAMVLCALLDAGRAVDDKAVLAAVGYLLATQDDEGLWPNNGWLQTMLPPDQFYEYDGERMCRPLEALGRWRRAVDARVHPPSPHELLRPLTPPGPFPMPAHREAGVWAPAVLSAARAFADPSADALITSIFEHGQEAALSALMATLVRSDDPLPEALPDAAKYWFRATEFLPPFADHDKLKRAGALYEQHGWAVALGLFTSSLPQAYCAAKGSRVLLQTQGITRHTRRRILETAQFVFDIMNPGGFDPGGRGIRALQKVRLMHAAVRHLILMKGTWDAPSWGVPINQEDLAGTLMTFSVVILDVFRAVGITLDDKDQEAFMHLWLVAGHFMGVNHALMPVNVDDGYALMQAIRRDQWRGSVEGTQLAEALMACMDDYLPGPLFANLPAALVRRIAGDEVADMLAMPPSDWTTLVVDFALDVDTFVNRFAPPKGPGDRLLRHIATSMMEALINVQREGKQAAFRIPLELIHG